MNVISHILTFDLEEYFQVEAASGIPKELIDTFPKRSAYVTRKILEMLNKYNASATFFVLGKLARTDPALVREIAEAGCEIASHSMTHKMITGMDREQFRGEILDSKKLLEDIISRQICGFRAPTFSITEKTTWALDILIESGITYDSSIFPIRHDRYGIPGAPNRIHRAITPGGKKILEIPPLTVNIKMLNLNLPVGGGGYFRIIPVRLTSRAISSSAKKGEPAMLYLHPWELDPNQPVMPMTALNRFRHRVGLAGCEAKLRFLLEKFEFTSVSKLLAELNKTKNVIQEFKYI